MERKINKKKRRHSELKSYINSKTNSNLQDLFTQAQQYPSFFNQNLIDDDRKIKVFHHHPHTHQIIFYFQLLRLTFEIENQDYEKYLVKIYDLIDNSEFQFQKPEANDEYFVPLGSNRIKKMIQQFLQEMGQGNMFVIEALSKYPIMQKILVIFIRSILIAGQVCTTFNEKLQVKETYQFLAHYFEIELTFYENCLSFNQTDIFVYFQSQDEVYLAYIAANEQMQAIHEVNQFYDNDQEQVFNISSVKQMISQIDIQVDGSFNLSKNYEMLSNQNVEFEYSHSSNMKKRQSKSIQSNSDFKFSHLIVQDLNASQNSQLNKDPNFENMGVQKKKSNKIIKQQNLIFQIQEVPLEQNNNSPFNTPRGSNNKKFRQKDRSNNYEKQNNYQKYKDYSQQNEISNESPACERRKFRDFSNQHIQQNKDQFLRFLIYKGKNEEQESIDINQKRCPTVKSIYFRSVNTINNLQSQSILAAQNYLEQKIKDKKLHKKSSFFPEKYNEVKQPQKSMVNVSKQFTNSFIIKQMKEPFQSHIRQIKQRARKNRINVQKMIYY